MWSLSELGERIRLSLCEVGQLFCLGDLLAAEKHAFPLWPGGWVDALCSGEVVIEDELCTLQVLEKGIEDGANPEVVFPLILTSLFIRENPTVEHEAAKGVDVNISKWLHPDSQTSTRIDHPFAENWRNLWAAHLPLLLHGTSVLL